MGVHGEGDGGAGREHQQEENDDEPGPATVGANQRLVDGRHLNARQHSQRQETDRALQRHCLIISSFTLLFAK